MAIESEEKRQRLNETITHWAENTKVISLLRDYYIPGLVNSILEEFYHIRLSCGHWVDNLGDGVPLEFTENDGSIVHGTYCHDCAEDYKTNLNDKEIHNSFNKSSKKVK